MFKILYYPRIENTTATTQTHSTQKQSISGLAMRESNSLNDQVQGINSLVKAGETTNTLGAM